MVTSPCRTGRCGSAYSNSYDTPQKFHPRRPRSGSSRGGGLVVVTWSSTWRSSTFLHALLVRLYTQTRSSVTRFRIGFGSMLLSGAVRVHALQLLRPRLAPAAVWMAAEIEPLCDGCPFRCDGCPWDWMDEGIEPQLLLSRDRQARQELGLDEDDFVDYVTERFGAATLTSVDARSGTEPQEVGFSDSEPG